MLHKNLLNVNMIVARKLTDKNEKSSYDMTKCYGIIMVESKKNGIGMAVVL